MWQERLDNFYSDLKYVSDLQQFNFHTDNSLTSRESEVSGEKLLKPVEHAFWIKNPFAQVWGGAAEETKDNDFDFDIE